MALMGNDSSLSSGITHGFKVTLYVRDVTHDSHGIFQASLVNLMGKNISVIMAFMGNHTSVILTFMEIIHW